MPPGLNPVTAQKLDAFARRRRMLIAVRGLCAGVISLLCAMTVVAIVDRLVILSIAARWAMSLSAYATSILIVWLTCIRLMVRIPNRAELARRIEAASPELHENLIAAVELGSPQSDDRFDSPVFRALLQQRVARDMDGLRIDRVLPAGLIRRWAMTASGVLAVCIVLMLIPGLGFGDLFVRAVAPMIDKDRVSSVRVRIVTPNPADTFVPHNETVTITVEHVAGPQPDELYVETQRDERDGESETLLMRPDGEPGTYAATVQVGRHAMTYRITGSGVQTRQYTIDAGARPRVVTFTKTYTPPRYLRLQPRTVEEQFGDLEGVSGTVVDLRLQVDQPMREAELRIDFTDGSATTIPLVQLDNENTLRADVPISKTGNYKVRLVAAATGFENKYDASYEINALADLPPVVELHAPTQPLIVPADEVVQLRATASDDHGLDKVTQVVQINDAEPFDAPLGAEPGAGAPGINRRFDITRTWDLYDLALKPGDHVVTRIAATDRAGQRAESPPIHITIAPNELAVDRLAGVEAKQKLLVALARMRQAARDAVGTLADVAPRLDNAAELKRRRLLFNVADAARDLSEQADQAWRTARTAIDANGEGSSAADIEFVGRIASRLRDELTSRAVAAVQRAAELNDAALTRAEFDTAGEALRDAARVAEQAESSFAARLAADEAAAIVRELSLLADEHARIDPSRWPDEPATWQRLARRLRVADAQAQRVESLARALAGRSGEADGVTRVADLLKTSRDETATALQAEPTAAIAPAANAARQAIDGAREAMLLVALKDAAARRSRRTLESLAPPAATVTAVRGGDEHAWPAAIDRLHADAALHEARRDADRRFAADLGLTRRALQNLHRQSQRNETVRNQARDAINEVAPAFAVLEAGHRVAELHALSASLTAREKWRRSPADTYTQHPRDFDFVAQRLSPIANALRDADMSPGAAARLGELADSSTMLRLDAAMMTRRARGAPGSWQGDTLADVTRELAAVNQLIAADMARARAVITHHAPTLDELMAKLADEAEQLGEQSKQTAEQVRDATEAENADEMQPRVEALEEKQGELNEQLADVTDALRQEANLQDAFDEQGRQRARDADDAVLMLDQPSRRAAEAMRQAAAERDAQAQQGALEDAAAAQNELADNLRQLARHFDEDSPADRDDTRAALRDAETQLGAKEQLDREFNRMQKLAELAKLSPREQLAALEEELRRDPAMQRELSDIARDAVRDARADLDRAAAHERRIAQDLAGDNARTNDTDANDGQLDQPNGNALPGNANDAQQPNAQQDADAQVNDNQPNGAAPPHHARAAEALRDIAAEARRLATSAPPPIQKQAAQGQSPKAAQQAEQAGRQLNQAANQAPAELAADARTAAQQARDVQRSLQQAAGNFKAAGDEARQTVETIREAERNAAATLSLGDPTREQRQQASDTLLHARRWQEAGKDAAAQADRAAAEANKLAARAAAIADQFDRAVAERQQRLADAAAEQPRIADDVEQAAQDVARAARHEQRLNNAEGHRALDAAARDIEQQAAPAVRDAGEQLARADDPAAARAAVTRAEQALDRQAQRLADLLGESQAQRHGEQRNAAQPNEASQTDQRADAEPSRSGDQSSNPSPSESTDQSQGQQPGESQGQQRDQAQGQQLSQQNGSRPSQRNGQSPSPRNNGQQPNDRQTSRWMARALDDLDRSLNQPLDTQSLADAAAQRRDAQANNAQQPSPGQGESSAQSQSPDSNSQNANALNGNSQHAQNADAQNANQSANQNPSLADGASPGQGESPGQSQANAQQNGSPGQNQSPGQSPGQGQPGQADGQPKGAPSNGQPSQASQAIQQAAREQAQAMARARQRGGTPGQPAQSGQGQGSPAMAQGGQGQSPANDPAGQPGQNQTGQPNPSGEPGQQAGAGAPTGAAVDAQSRPYDQLPELDALKNGDWGKLPRRLARDLMEGRRDAVPAEYRAAVEAYFRAIARQARDEAPRGDR